MILAGIIVTGVGVLVVGLVIVVGFAVFAVMIICGILIRLIIMDDIRQFLKL